MIVASCLVLAFSACGDSSTQSSSSADVLIGKEGRPDVPVPEGAPPAGLGVEDLEKGTGAASEEGDQLAVRYFSFDYRSHRIGEDRWGDSRPLSFTLGAGEVLAAWETGLQGMRPGGRRELIVPAKLNPGSGDQIFVIELLSVDSPRPAAIRSVNGSEIKPQLPVSAGRTPKKLVVRELKAGSGRAVRPGERLGVRYVGVNYKTGKVDDRWDEDPPYSFILGEGDIREGWEIGLKGMKLGARRELILPSRLAYGDGPMAYVVELIEVEKR